MLLLFLAPAHRAELAFPLEPWPEDLDEGQETPVRLFVELPDGLADDPGDAPGPEPAFTLLGVQVFSAACGWVPARPTAALSERAGRQLGFYLAQPQSFGPVLTLDLDCLPAVVPNEPALCAPTKHTAAATAAVGPGATTTGPS